MFEKVNPMSTMYIKKTKPPSQPGFALSKKTIIIVATEEEYEIAKKRFIHNKIIKTGVGAINIINKLKDLNKKTKLLNFGYVGSNTIKIGKEIIISDVELYHPNVKYKEARYKLNNNGIKCYTYCDFVTETDITEPCVFDMELAFILALGFKNVQSIKIISDNLSLKQYEENIK